jgi:ribonuclease R
VILTIDGAGAKDLDDAVSVSRLKGGKYRLSVHIADVSSYIKPKGALERTAFSRGCSVYFVDQVVPMLPPVLSNGVCSLHPGEKKATLTATMILSPEGEIEKCTLERTLIESRVRGVYSEVNDLYEKGKQSEFYEKYKGVYPTLLRLLELYEILKKKSERRGAVELDTAESVILLDEQGAPKDILPAERGVAERIIEQMMLSANEGVATTLRALSLPCVYRVHENPPPDKMESFFSYLNSLDIRTGTVRPDEVKGEQLNRFLAQAEEKGVKESVSYAMLRSMAKAKYSATECSHYGLGMECYCHFTSPIRRLSDLCVHRVISRVLLGEEAAKRYSSLAARGAAAATDGELRAVAAERRIENLYKVIYMEGRVGEVFSARVSSVNSFGVFAMLENTCEGLIPLSSMTGVFSFDEKRHRLVSRHHTYAVGDTIEVRLTEADRIRGKLAFADVRDEGAWREDE